MLSQHHDCWIVPLNSHPAGTWSKQVTTDWIPNTLRRCDGVLSGALQNLTAGGGASGEERFVRVVNPVSVDRREAVAVVLPAGWAANGVKVHDGQNREVPCQNNGVASRELVFLASVPSLGYATYRIVPTAGAPASTGARAETKPDGTVVVETDQYEIVLDPAKGGCLKSLYDKTLRHEFVDPASPRRFNEYRGYSGMPVPGSAAPTPRRPWRSPRTVPCAWW